jgi:hypothetical protein
MAMPYPLERRQEITLDDQLRLEAGWGDVARGLRQVVVGYLVLVLGITLGAFLVVMSVVEMGGFTRAPARLSIGAMWQFYIGMGIISLTGLISWGMVMAGKFRCMLNAPERHSARWLIFVCMTCTFVAPTFNVAAGIGFAQRPVELQRGAFGLQELKLNTTGRIIHLIGFGCGLLSPLAFVLFLRAIARCLELRGHLLVMNGYAAISAGLMALTCYVLFAPPRAPRMLVVYALLLGGGWLMWGVAYLVMTLILRSSIVQALGNIRSPLEAEPPQQFAPVSTDAFFRR